MKRIRLTPNAKHALELRHMQTQNGRERDRIKAVLLRSEGWTVPMISQALRLHQTTVTRHLNDYREGKLTIASGGSESLLNDEQTTLLIAHLSAHTYQTTDGIIAYVKAQYGVSYSIPGMNKWLHRHGFSYKKPKGHPDKACPEQQEAFKAHYESLKAALAEDEAILFMDTCHPSMGTKVSHGWIKQGGNKKY